MNDPSVDSQAGITLVDELAVDRFRELQRFAELGRLSASLLHEISNPLTAALLHLEQHHDQESLNLKQVRRNMQLLERYVTAARQQLREGGHPANFYVRTQLSQVRRVLIPLARRAGVRLYFDLPANYRMFGDPVKFQQIITNLVVNAIDSYKHELYSNEPKEVRISIVNRGQWILIRVWDRGAGIGAERLNRLFEPFYTTKGQYGHGLGIGLTMVKQYVEQDFTGSITVTSSAQRGTQFTVRLRLAPRYHRRPLHPQAQPLISGDS